MADHFRHGAVSGGDRERKRPSLDDNSREAAVQNAIKNLLRKSTLKETGTWTASFKIYILFRTLSSSMKLVQHAIKL